MLGLKTLPVNHPLHRFYRTVSGVVGLLLVVFGLVALIVSGDRLLGVTAGTAFSVLCLVVGAVLIGGAFAGGNLAAEVNAYGGALLLAIGLYCLLFMRTEDANVLDAQMSDVIVLFVVGMIVMAAGLYGRVGPATRAHA
jgi:hypothetical protein